MISDNANFVLIGWVMLATAFAILWFKIQGPRGWLARLRSQQVAELEVKIRMGYGPALAQDLCHLARLCASSSKFWEAEQYFRHALQITERELGKSSQALLPIYKDYGRLLDKMQRKAEAKTIRKKAAEISARKPPVR